MRESAAVLDPLLARYASWLALPSELTSDVSDEDPDNVVLMPLVLRLERSSRPERSALLESAAAAAIAVCLDERAEPGGAWHEAVYGWVTGRIRKVARRARGSHWEAAQQLPGRTIEVGGAQVRALLPTRVADMPKEVTRLQISGSELEPGDPGPPASDVPVLWLNPDIPMSAGKAAAQTGHATMFLAALLHGDGLDEQLAEWIRREFPCSVRTADHATWQRLARNEEPRETWQQRRVVTVRDAGFTEVDPGTVTVLAQWR